MLNWKYKLRFVALQFYLTFIFFCRFYTIALLGLDIERNILPALVKLHGNSKMIKLMLPMIICEVDIKKNGYQPPCVNYREVQVYMYVHPDMFNEEKKLYKGISIQLFSMLSKYTSNKHIQL